MRRVRGSTLSAFALRLVLTSLLLSPLAQAADKSEAIPTAPVVIDGVELFQVRGVTAFPAQERAATITGLVEECAASELALPALSLESTELGIQIRCGPTLLMTALNADAELEGVRLGVLAEVQRRKLEEAIARWRADRTRDALLRGAGIGAAVLVGLVVVVLLLRWIFRRIDTRLDAVLKAQVKDVGIQSFQFLRAETIWRALRWVMGTLHLSLAVAALLVAGQRILVRFPWTRGAAHGLAELVLGPLKTLGGKALGAVPGVIFIGILVYLARAVLKALHLFFTAVERGNVSFKSFAPEWANPTYRLIRLLVIGLTLVIAYPYIPGSDSEAFKGLSIMVGVLLSLGGSSYVSNMIAGYTMTFRRAFRVGDRIRVGDVAGVVSETRLQVTHVRTMKNEEVVLPNSEILGSAVTNYSSLAKTQGLLLHTNVGIGYETPWRQVEAMLLLSAKRASTPEHAAGAFVLIKALGDFAVTYELNVPHADALTMDRQYSVLHRHVLDVFNEYGVQIMTPAYEGDPEQPKLVPRKDWFTAPATPSAESGETKAT
ncbi:MAG: mechanosensitive ion channel [Myxococcales bacterium]|nr:mechanosensitive ion channel [Myxococcales bacterium]